MSEKETCGVEELISYISKNYNVEFKSKHSYYALLKKAGMSWKKTEKRNPKKDEDLVASKKEEIKKNSANEKKQSLEVIWSY